MTEEAQRFYKYAAWLFEKADTEFGLKIDDVARAAGSSWSYVWEFAKGRLAAKEASDLWRKRVPPPDFCAKLAKALRCTPEEECELVTLSLLAREAQLRFLLEWGNKMVRTNSVSTYLTAIVHSPKTVREEPGTYSTTRRVPLYEAMDDYDGPSDFLNRKPASSMLLADSLFCHSPEMPGQPFSLRMPDDSMIQRGIGTGDLVVNLTTLEPMGQFTGSRMATVWFQKKITVRDIKQDKEGVSLTAGNPSFPASYIPRVRLKQEFRVIGYVVGVWKYIPNAPPTTPINGKKPEPAPAGKPGSSPQQEAPVLGESAE